MVEFGEVQMAASANQCNNKAYTKLRPPMGPVQSLTPYQRLMNIN